MSNQKIDAKLFAKMFLCGAANLESNKEWINELNVFPVPDGDTGTNMTMTIMSAAKEVEALGEEPEMAALCKAISSGSLRGARGNSGVILSQLFRGFTKRIKEEEEVTIPIISEACAKAVETAYKAVMKPKEGTILTVAKGMSEKAAELTEAGYDDMEKFLLEILEHGKYVLSQTPEMLPVLKQAGVVDSGGQGLIQVLTGCMDAYQGKEIDYKSMAKPDTSGIIKPVIEEEKIKNLYYINFVITLKSSFNVKKEMDLKLFLESIGEDIEVVAGPDDVNVKLKTNDPGLALQKAIKYGELTDVVVINRRLQPDCENIESGASKPTEPPKKYGFIAVSAGEGLNEIFRSLGVDYIIEGGQTMNPSTADILAAVDMVNAETVFVLPNNKNIILAANQASELVTDKTLLVIPTKTIPQGITAVINFVADITPDENESAMMNEISRVKTGQVTYAVRDTIIDDKEIKKDDFMGIGDKGILSNGKDMDEVILSMLEQMVDDESELISIYYGQDVTSEDADRIGAKVSEKFPDLDMEIQSGGQPIYYYIMSVE